jgi:hypothetical protein
LAIVEQLSRELKERGLTVKDGAEKSLEIAVDDSHFERGMWNVAVTIEFTVAFGIGKVKHYSIRNSSPSTVGHTYDGAVALAVIEILDDSEVLAYVTE